MKEVQEDWASAYKKAKIELEKEIHDIDIFDCSVAKFLLEFFKAGHLVLEAGCGTGRFCFWLNKKGFSCVGIDIVPEIVKKAAFYAKEKGLPTSFIIADVCNLPLRDKSVDGYISLGVVEHFRSTMEVIKAFKECRRVLKKAVGRLSRFQISLFHYEIDYSSIYLEAEQVCFTKLTRKRPFTNWDGLLGPALRLKCLIFGCRSTTSLTAS
jgi:ubiquinone/menaquinone biosynthesis C-methylase UbiE